LENNFFVGDDNRRNTNNSAKKIAQNTKKLKVNTKNSIGFFVKLISRASKDFINKIIIPANLKIHQNARAQNNLLKLKFLMKTIYGTIP
jgi:hypothetical protein